MLSGLGLNVGGMGSRFRTFNFYRKHSDDLKIATTLQVTAWLAAIDDIACQ